MTIPNTAKQISTLFEAEIPSTLWHYTSATGAAGIIKSQAIWATDSGYLNDSTEIVHFLDLARLVLSEISIKSASKFARAAVDETIEAEFARGFLSATKSQFFITSFSQAGDDLGQWRAYAQSTRGVAIGFDLTGIRPPSELKSMVTFAPCVYEDGSKKELISELITSFFDGEREVQGRLKDNAWLSQQLRNWKLMQRVLGLGDDHEGFKEHTLNLISETIKDATTQFRGNLMRLACHFKHSGFKGEQEWRLVLPHLRSKTDVVSPIMKRGEKEIPYVSFDLHNLGRGRITKLMLGPCCKADEVKTLQNGGYKGVIEKSKIPLRCD